MRIETTSDSVPTFDSMLAAHGVDPLIRESPRTLQVNVGKLCNQACHHCHVDAGPKRTERMSQETAEQVLNLLARSPGVATLDITGGAPELNPNFSMIVERARALRREVIVRCNLTVLLEPGMEWLGGFYGRNRVHMVCSLPCYSEENVEKQRGKGVFAKSIEALRRLNSVGYGRNGLRLDLVYNPVGPELPPGEAELEERYRRELRENFGVEFSRLITITNLPIARFAHQLHTWGRYSDYMSLLVNHFNPRTAGSVMCRSLVSVGWEGSLYDCDFNQMLGMQLESDNGCGLTIWDIDDLVSLRGRRIATGGHCFGCTAGAGSSCSGALEDSSSAFEATAVAR